jgi:hypothetical protein
LEIGESLLESDPSWHDKSWFSDVLPLMQTSVQLRTALRPLLPKALTFYTWVDEDRVFADALDASHLHTLCSFRFSTFFMLGARIVMFRFFMCVAIPSFFLRFPIPTWASLASGGVPIHRGRVCPQSVRYRLMASPIDLNGARVVPVLCAIAVVWVCADAVGTAGALPWVAATFAGFCITVDVFGAAEALAWAATALVGVWVCAGVVATAEALPWVAAVPVVGLEMLAADPRLIVALSVAVRYWTSFSC